MYIINPCKHVLYTEQKRLLFVELSHNTVMVLCCLLFVIAHCLMEGPRDCHNQKKHIFFEVACTIFLEIFVVSRRGISHISYSHDTLLLKNKCFLGVNTSTGHHYKTVYIGSSVEQGIHWAASRKIQKITPSGKEIFTSAIMFGTNCSPSCWNCPCPWFMLPVAWTKGRGQQNGHTP